MRRLSVKFILICLCALLALPAFAQGSPSKPLQDDVELRKLDELLIHAPRKAFVSIAEGGHFAVFMKSELFLNELVSRVLPLAKRR
jgi:hypothetical protein